MSLPRLWAVLAVALPALAAVIASISTVDLAYQLRAGADILDGRGIPRIDAWTYTVAGRPWHDQQWLAQVVFALAERTGGWTGLVVLRAALVGATFGLVALAAVRRGTGTRTASLLALAAFAVSAVALGLRPQLFGILLFAVVLVLVGERDRHPGWLWLIVPLTALWANLHGSFVLGPALLALAWLEDAVGRRGHAALVIAIAAAGATLLNPWGVDVWRYAIGLTADANVRERVTEWQPTLPSDVPGILFYASGVAVALLVLRRRPLPAWPVLLTLDGFFALGVVTGLGIAWWPLVAAVTTAGLLAPRGGRSSQPAGPPGGAPRAPSRPAPAGLRPLNALGVAVLVLAGVVALPFWRPLDPGTGAPVGLLLDAPSGVTRALRETVVPGDRVFAPQTWGSWIELAVPAATVAVDSRIELFPASVWGVVERVLRGDAGWDEELRAWGVTVVVRRPGETAFHDRLEGAGWRTVYAGEDGAVLVRSDRAG